jgi:hypothetical protein
MARGLAEAGAAIAIVGRNEAKSNAGGALGDIGDFAGIAVFLSSSASDFVTRTAIPVDGGFSIMG